MEAMTWPSIQEASEMLRVRIVAAQRAEFIRKFAYDPMHVLRVAA